MMARWGQSDRWCRIFTLVAIGVAVFDLIIFNVFLYYVFGFLLEIKSAYKYPTFKEGLTSIGAVRSTIEYFKDGVFSKLEQETLGRLFIRSHKVPPWLQTNSSGDYVSYFGLDVTHSGEASFIMKRMLSKSLAPDVSRLVVDIGANDGLMSSNSYNFIQMGWDAVLVEPLKRMLEIATKNLKRIREPVTNRMPKVTFVKALIGDHDGHINFAVAHDVSTMESHVADSDHPPLPGQKIVKLKSITVASLRKQYKIPRRFGLLSIDAEGVGDKILKAFMEEGLRPSYIIYETIHLNIAPAISKKDLRAYGYSLLTHRGWNNIFEYAGDELDEKVDKDTEELALVNV